MLKVMARSGSSRFRKVCLMAGQGKVCVQNGVVQGTTRQSNRLLPAEGVYKETPRQKGSR